MKKRFSEAQIIGFLLEAEAGLPRRQTRWQTPLLHVQLPRLAILIREQPDRPLVEWQ